MVRTSEFGIGVMVDPDKWDSKLQRVKGNSDAARDTNRRLDIIKSEIEQIYLAARASGKKVNANQVKDAYLGHNDVVCSVSRMGELYVSELSLKGRASTTIMRYERCYQYLSDYLGKEMEAGSVEKKHVSGFWKWLKARGYHNDYCNKIVQACIGLFRFGMREDYVEKNPFSGYALEWKKELDTTCLDPDELDLMIETSWSDRLQKAVDSFLFMCYTGLHIGDYQEIGGHAVYEYHGQKFMKVKRIKTGIEAIFPITDKANELIQKYGGLDKLPHISAQKMNDYLKLIAERVGIEKNLTNKIARKTFTNMCLNELGYSPEVVATMLGHTSTRQVKHYGSIKEKRILKEMEKIKAA